VRRTSSFHSFDDPDHAILARPPRAPMPPCTGGGARPAHALAHLRPSWACGPTVAASNTVAYKAGRRRDCPAASRRRRAKTSIRSAAPVLPIYDGQVGRGRKNIDLGKQSADRNPAMPPSCKAISPAHALHPRVETVGKNSASRGSRGSGMQPAPAPATMPNMPACRRHRQCRPFITPTAPGYSSPDIARQMGDAGDRRPGRCATSCHGRAHRRGGNAYCRQAVYDHGKRVSAVAALARGQKDDACGWQGGCRPSRRPCPRPPAPPDPMKPRWSCNGEVLLDAGQPVLAAGYLREIAAAHAQPARLRCRVGGRPRPRAAR